MADQKTQSIMIIEVAGRPPEHLAQALSEHVDKINNIKGAKILNKKISEPRRIDHPTQEAYTCFAEVEVETESFPILINLVFDFMPSSIEVLEPENLNLNLQDATGFLSDLAGRLHKYDEIAKIARFQTQQLAAQLQQLQQPAQETQPTIKKEKTKKTQKKKSVKKKVRK